MKWDLANFEGFLGLEAPAIVNFENGIVDKVFIPKGRLLRASYLRYISVDDLVNDSFCIDLNSGERARLLANRYQMMESNGDKTAKKEKVIIKDFNEKIREQNWPQSQCLFVSGDVYIPKGKIETRNLDKRVSGFSGQIQTLVDVNSSWYRGGEMAEAIVDSGKVPFSPNLWRNNEGEVWVRMPRVLKKEFEVLMADQFFFKWEVEGRGEEIFDCKKPREAVIERASL